MSELEELDNSEQHNTELYNIDVDQEGCITIDKQKCTATICCVEHENTDLSSVPKPHQVANIINTKEDPTIKTHGAETHDTKEANIVQEVTGADGVMKDETKILSNATNITVKNLCGFADDISSSETDQCDDGDVQKDTVIPGFDKNVTQLSGDSSAHEIVLEKNFCDKTECMKGKSLPVCDIDVWCKNLELPSYLQLPLIVLIQTPRNLIEIKTGLRKGVINFFQKLERQTSGLISKIILPVIKGAHLGLSIVTFAVREYITWSDEPFIRIILNNEMLKQYFLVRECFRLATFGHYSRRIPRPVVLKLARNGYFCDPDGTIRCFRCYTELSEIDACSVHNRCRFSYMLENISIRNNYGHLAPERILGVNHQNRNDLLIRGLRCFDDVVLHRTPFQEQRRRQLLPPLDTSAVIISLDSERRRRGVYSDRTIDLQRHREPHAPTENINIQSRGLISMTVNSDQGALLNSNTYSSVTCHTNTTSTAVENQEHISNGTPAVPFVTNSFLLSDETHVKQLDETSDCVRLGNSTGTIVTDIQSRNQHQQESIEIPDLQYSHSSVALLSSISSAVQPQANRINSTQQPCNVCESEPPMAVSFRGSNTNTIETGSVQPEQLQKPECKDSIIPAPDIPTVSMNSEHGEDNQPENVDFALQTSPGPKQTSSMTLCDKSVHGPHDGNSLQPTVAESFKSIRKRHSSQPTSDKSDSEARRNVLPRRVIRTRRYSEPTVASKSKPSSTVAQAFYESLEDSFTPRSEQRECSLARSEQENKPFRRLDHSDESASEKVPNTVDGLMHASLQIEETDVFETEQNQGAVAASQSITVINSGDEAARAIKEHQNRRRRKTV